MQTDRQASRQADRQAGRQADRQTSLTDDKSRRQHHNNDSTARRVYIIKMMYIIIIIRSLDGAGREGINEGRKKAKDMNMKNEGWQTDV